MSDIEIIGFDLGHGESALVRTRQQAKVEPTSIEIDSQRTIMTAIGMDAQSKLKLGREILTAAPNLKISYTRFKHPDLDQHPFAGKAIRLFVQAIVERLTEQRQLSNFAEAHFFVGCPAGWSPRVQKEYKNLLSQSGLKNVDVIPESRAAFLHARETRELNINQLEGHVLLIDIGSSTTDFTYSENLNSHPIDFGYTEIGDIGAGLIDQLILEHVIESQNNVAAIKVFLEQNPGKMSELDLKCREAKEEYFKQAAGKGEEICHLVRLEKGKMLEITLDDKLMSTLLTKPIASLGNLSWVSAFKARLTSARDQHEVAPEFVIITGGAARMGFLINLISSVFPNSRIVRGKEPELAIAKGLAWFGRAYLSSREFIAEVETLIRSQAIETMVADSIPKLHTAIAEKLSQVIIRDIIRVEMLAWRNGDTDTLRRMEQKIKERFQMFMRSKEVALLISDIAKMWFNQLRPSIHELTDPICIRHHVPTSALDIPPDTHYSTQSASVGPIDVGLDEIGTVISAVVATIIGMISGGAGVSLLHLPLIGQIILGVVAFIVLFAGKDEAIETVKDWNIFEPVRWMISEARIDSKLLESKAELISGLKQDLARAEDSAHLEDKLAIRISKQIDQALRQRTDDTILRFGC